MQLIRAEIILFHPGFSRVLIWPFLFWSSKCCNSKNDAFLYYYNWVGLIISTFIRFINIIKEVLIITELRHMLWHDTHIHACTHKHALILYIIYLVYTHIHTNLYISIYYLQIYCMVWYQFTNWSNQKNSLFRWGVEVVGVQGWILLTLESGILMWLFYHALASPL